MARTRPRRLLVPVLAWRPGPSICIGPPSPPGPIWICWVVTTCCAWAFAAPPIQARHARHTTAEEVARGQACDPELSLLIGPRRRAPALCRCRPLLRVLGEHDDGVFLDGLSLVVRHGARDRL